MKVCLWVGREGGEKTDGFDEFYSFNMNSDVKSLLVEAVCFEEYL